MPNLPFATANYLVPLDGTTHVVVAGLVATAATHKINWPAFSNDNFSFWPQGAYIDNSGSIADLTLVVKPIDFSVTIAAGAKQIVSWPAPKNQETWLTGNGPATIFFVNYPLLSTPAEVDGKLSVTLASGATVSIGGQPISTVAELQAYDPVGVVWDSVVNQTPADAAPGAAGVLTTAQLLAYNGATWDMVKSSLPSLSVGIKGIVTTAQIVAQTLGGLSWNPITAHAPIENTITNYNHLLVQSVQKELVGGFWRFKRNPGTFKTGKFTAAGSGVLWTPTAGTSFRLMRYKIDVTGDAVAAAAGYIDLTFYDALTAMPLAETAYIPLAVAGTAFTSGWVDLGNGILSALADNVLSMNLSGALTGGVVRVTVAGTEE